MAQESLTIRNKGQGKGQARNTYEDSRAARMHLDGIRIQLLCRWLQCPMEDDPQLVAFSIKKVISESSAAPSWPSVPEQGFVEQASQRQIPATARSSMSASSSGGVAARPKGSGAPAAVKFEAPADEGHPIIAPQDYGIGHKVVAFDHGVPASGDVDDVLGTDPELTESS